MGVKVVAFTHVGTLWSAQYAHLYGVTGLTAVAVGSSYKLFAASQVDGGLTAFNIFANSLAGYNAALDYTAVTGTLGAAGLTSAVLSGQVVLVPAGRYDDSLALHKISATGGFNGTVAPFSGTPQGYVTSAVVIKQNGSEFLITSEWNRDGLTTWKVNADLSLTQVARLRDTNTSYAADVATIATVTCHGKTFVLTASANEDGLTVHYFKNSGGFTTYGSLGANDGVGIDKPTALAALVVGGQAYAVLGASGSGSLSVFLIASTGALTQTDHRLDDLTTRFDDVSAVETFSVQGRGFVVAGGSDGGITLFELLPGGTLLERAVQVDTSALSLANVSAIETLVQGAKVKLWVASANEHGISQLGLDFTGLTAPMMGTRYAENLTGSAGHDLLYGWRGNDTLSGGSGDDILMDGPGTDVMWGGAGADTFVLADDWYSDTIRDFEKGIDDIDLSAWDMLYAKGQLEIVPKSYGAAILYQHHWLGVYTADGTSLQASDFTAADILFS